MKKISTLCSHWNKITVMTKCINSTIKYNILVFVQKSQTE